MDCKGVEFVGEYHSLVFTQTGAGIGWRMLAKPIAPCDESSRSSRMEPESSRQNTYRGGVGDCEARSHRALLPDIAADQSAAFKPLSSLL